jgi:hypothetical protein
VIGLMGKCWISLHMATAFYVASATAPALLNHKDEDVAIAPSNHAAFPLSLEVNVENARNSFLHTSYNHAVVSPYMDSSIIAR